MDIGETEIAPGIAEREFFVVEAEQLENRCMEIVDVDFVLDGRETEFVGGAMDHAAFDAAASQPHRKTVMVVIPAVNLAGIRAGCRQLDDWRPSKFPSPHHQRLF